MPGRRSISTTCSCSSREACLQGAHGETSRPALRGRRGALRAARRPPRRSPGSAATPDTGGSRGQAGGGHNAARPARQRPRQATRTLAAALLPGPRRRDRDRVMYKQHFALKHYPFQRTPHVDELFEAVAPARSTRPGPESPGPARHRPAHRRGRQRQDNCLPPSRRGPAHRPVPGSLRVALHRKRSRHLQRHR